MILALCSIAILLVVAAIYVIATAFHAFMNGKLDDERMVGVCTLGFLLLGVAVGMMAIASHGFDAKIMFPNVSLEGTK